MTGEDVTCCCDVVGLSPQLWQGVSVPAGDVGGTTRGAVERHNVDNLTGEDSTDMLKGKGSFI